MLYRNTLQANNLYWQAIHTKQIGPYRAKVPVGCRSGTSPSMWLALLETEEKVISNSSHLSWDKISMYLEESEVLLDHYKRNLVSLHLKSCTCTSEALQSIFVYKVMGQWQNTNFYLGVTALYYIIAYGNEGLGLTLR